MFVACTTKQQCTRRTFLSYLPVPVLGTSSMNANASGSHHFATRSARCAAQVLGAARRRPSRRTTQASGRSVQRSSGMAMTAASSDVRVRDELLLELDRRDPLAARLDDVLRAVGDPDEAALVDRRDVAGAQPAVVELLRRVDAEVARRHPRSADLELAVGLAVARQHLAVLADDARLDERQDPPGGVAVAPAAVAVAVAPRRPRERRQRPGLGHPPRLDDAHAVALLERLHQRQRDGGAAADDGPQRARGRRARRPGARAGRATPSGPPRRSSRARRSEQRGERLGLREARRQQQVGAGQAGRVRQPPRVRVEHRDHREHAVGATRRRCCRSPAARASAASASGASRRRPSGGRSCRSCSRGPRPRGRRGRGSRTRPAAPTRRSS